MGTKIGILSELASILRKKRRWDSGVLGFSKQFKTGQLLKRNDLPEFFLRFCRDTTENAIFVDVKSAANISIDKRICQRRVLLHSKPDGQRRK
jgi:hypothetical protein